MYYAPHILQIKVVTPERTDEYGRPVPESGGEEWKTICRCRCDDNTTREFKSPNGEVYRPNYHVVCETRFLDVKAGMEARCLEGNSIRGEGRIYIPKKTNYFNYSEIWL